MGLSMKNRFVLLIIAMLTQFTSILPERGIFSLFAGPFKDDALKDNLAICKKNIRDEADEAVRKKEIALLEDIYRCGKFCPDIDLRLKKEGGLAISEVNKVVDSFKLDPEIKYDTASLSQSLGQYCKKIGAIKTGAVPCSVYSEEELLRSPIKNSDALDKIARAKAILASRGCLDPTIYWSANAEGSVPANITLTSGCLFNNNMFLVTNGDCSTFNNSEEGFKFVMDHEATHWERKDGLKTAIIRQILREASMNEPQAYHSWKREREKRADAYALTYASKCVRNPLKKEMLLDERDRSMHHQSPKKTYLMYEDLTRRMRTAKEQDKIALVENVRKHADAERIMQETMCPY